VQLWTLVRNFISANPELVAALGVIGTIGSIVLALLLYRFAKPRKLLAYATRTFRILPQPSVQIPRLEVTYNSHAVKALSVTRLTIWNAGNESLRRADIPPAHPPVITVPDGINLFEGKIVERTSAANNVSLESVYEPVIGYGLDFDFLDPGDGAVFHVVHEGTRLTDVRLTGELIGARIRRTLAQAETPDVSADEFPSKRREPRSGRAQMRFAIRLCMIVLPVLGFALIMLRNWGTGTFAISMGLLLGGSLFLLSRRAYPPARLKSFDENLKSEQEQ